MNRIQQEIYRFILEIITLGEIQTGEKLGTEQGLAQRFGTGRMNVHFAIKALEEAGIVIRNKRGGTLVSRCPGNFEYGKLLADISQTVYVLNHCGAQFEHLHWNSEVEAALKQNLDIDSLEIIYRNVSEIYDENEYAALLESLVASGCKALVIIPNGEISRRLSDDPEFLFKFHDQIVIYERGSFPWDENAYHLVKIDNFADGVQAAELLCREGYRNLLFCQSSSDSWWSDERRNGLFKGNLRYSDGKGVNAVFTLKKGDKTFPEVKDFALVAANDNIAAQLIDNAEAIGLKQNRDFRLISFNHDPELADYQLTSFCPDYQEIGSQLAGIIRNIINHKHLSLRYCIRIKSKI